MTPPAPLHGLGGSEAVAAPVPLVLVAMVVALVLTLVLRHRSGTPRSWPVAPGLPPPLLWGVRLVVLGFFGFLFWPLLLGPDLPSNPVVGVYQALVWVGLVPASLLLGPVVRVVGPVRTLNLLLAALLRSDPAVGVAAYPRRWGLWPAAVGLLLLAWQVLVDPRSTYLDSLRVWFTAYVAMMLVGAAVFGDTWLARADPFEVWSELLARLAPWARARVPEDQPGLGAVVAVLLGAGAADLLLASGSSPALAQTLTGTFLLLLACAVAGGGLLLASRAVGGGGEVGLVLVPVAAGLALAGHVTYLVEQGQATLRALSDPLARGDDLFGTASWPVDYWFSARPGLVAVVGVLVLLVAHGAATVAARRRYAAPGPAVLILVGTVVGLGLLAVG